MIARSKRPAWLRVDRLLGEWGIPKDRPAGRQRLEQALEERRGAEEGEEYQPIRRGWCLGEEKFREELLPQMIERMGAETTMTAGWIAEHLAMGTRGYCPLYPPLDLGGRVFRAQLRVSARTQCSAQAAKAANALSTLGSEPSMC